MIRLYVSPGAGSTESLPLHPTTTMIANPNSNVRIEIRFIVLSPLTFTVLGPASSRPQNAFFDAIACGD
jgi:hypothetical protein